MPLKTHTHTTHTHRNLFMLSEKGQRQDLLCPGVQKDMKELQKKQEIKSEKEYREESQRVDSQLLREAVKRSVRARNKEEGRERTRKGERWDTTPDSVVAVIV